MVKKKNRKPLPQKVRDAASKSLQGNAFWQQRSKHGRDTLFNSPDLMWEAACEYFKWCDENPDYKSENKIVSNGGNMGSSVELCEEPVRRPYTIHGLCLYLGCGLAYFRQFKESAAYKKYKDFSTVIDNIEKTIYEDQFTGASNGFFNANIISRALGLIDKQDVTSAGEKIATPEFKVYNSAPPMASDEKEIEKKIKK